VLTDWYTYQFCDIYGTMKIKGTRVSEALIDVCKPHDVTVQNSVIFIFAVVKASKPHACVLIYLFNDAVSTAGGIWRRNVV
jgi:hypothetical protein